MNKIGGSKVQKILGAVVVTIMVVFTVTFLSCTAEREKKIDLNDVPQEVIDAVEDKYKEIEIQEVRVEGDPSVKEYKFKGIANGKKYKIKVRVLEETNMIKVEDESKD